MHAHARRFCSLTPAKVPKLATLLHFRPQTHPSISPFLPHSSTSLPYLTPPSYPCYLTPLPLTSLHLTPLTLTTPSHPLFLTLNRERSTLTLRSLGCSPLFPSPSLPPSLTLLPQPPAPRETQPVSLHCNLIFYIYI